ncbi:hypothetical protein COOONC_26588, partial [Cooperia oncophora]
TDNDWGDSKKGGGKKKGGRGGGGGKAAKSTGTARDESSSAMIGVPQETLQEWVLATEVVPEEIMEDVMEQIEAVQTSDVCDVQSALQPMAIPFDDADFIAISEQVASTENDLHSAGTHVFSDRMLSKTIERLNDRIDSWAHELLSRIEQERKGPQQQKKAIETDNDWGDSKKGGGKKKGGRGGGGGKAAKSTGTARDESSSAMIGVPQETLQEWVLATEVVPEEIMEDVMEQIGSQVDDKIRARVNEIAVSQQNAAAQSQKKSLAQLQQRAQGLYSSICMFESASSSFPDSLRDELRQYLLRTMGTDLANAALSCASGMENAGQLKEKQREETIASLPPALRDTVSSLYSSLRSENLDAFHSAVFDLSSPAALSIALRQPDSKARAEVLESYVAELKEQVIAQTDPAAVLLSCVLYLLAKHGKPVTASGRFVAQLVTQLNGVVEQSLFDLLVSVQRLVVQCLKNKTDEVAKDMLSSEVGKLKEMVSV